MYIVVLLDTAYQRAIVVNRTGLHGPVEVLAHTVATVEKTGFVRQMNLPAASAALGTGKRAPRRCDREQ